MLCHSSLLLFCSCLISFSTCAIVPRMIAWQFWLGLGSSFQISRLFLKHFLQSFTVVYKVQCYLCTAVIRRLIACWETPLPVKNLTTLRCSSIDASIVLHYCFQSMIVLKNINLIFCCSFVNEGCLCVTGVCGRWRTEPFLHRGEGEVDSFLFDTQS